MKKTNLWQHIYTLLLCMSVFTPTLAQWQISAKNFDPNNYYGVTVANGMVGITSSPDPLKVKEIVLNGTFDTYGRGRVANIMKAFEFANMELIIDNQMINRNNISNFVQTIDMQNAIFTTTFDMGNKASVKSNVLALRHLPHSALIEMEITAKQDIEFTPISIMQTPDMLRDVQNFFHTIDRPHSLIPLMTSVAKTPTGKHTIAASNSFLFEEERGKEYKI